MKTPLVPVFVILSFLRDVAPQRDRRLPPVGATIDQLIAGSMGGIEGYVNISNKLVTPDSIVLAELDMYVTYEQYKLLYSQKREREKRKAVRSAVLRWPKGLIPYEFKRGAYSNNDKYLIRVAMREWEKYTCLRFRKRRNDYNYVYFQDNFGCNSQLGMVGGSQALNLDRNGCRYKGLYLHEIGHAVGLVHEHQRPIRDQFIRINYRNVHPSLRQWFQKYPDRQIKNFNISYEFSSVMHYGITAFSVDGRSKTIETQPGYKTRESEIGRVYSKELSFTDIATVNNMYFCNRHCSKSIRCRNGGFVDQNCRCSCPDGTSDCEEGKVPQFQFCRNKDKDWSCNVWAKQGECQRNARYMKPNCARACGICGDALGADKVIGDQCVNAFPDDKCKGWKELGDCVSNQLWMNQNCKRTCGVCDKDSDPPESGCSNKHSDKKCDDWAIKGECSVNPRWMKTNCRKSCRMCPDNRTTTRPPIRKTTVIPPTTTSATTRPTTTTKVIVKTTRPTVTTTWPTTTTISTYRPETTTESRTTTQRPVLPSAPAVFVRLVTSTSVEFKVTFPRDRSTPGRLTVKPFQRELKSRDYEIEIVNSKPQDIKVEYTNLKPRTEYSFRFFSTNNAGAGKFIQKTITTKKQAGNSTCRNSYPTEKCQRLEQRWKYCTLYRIWMSIHCKDTCGLCPVQRDEPVIRNEDPNCKDTRKYCRAWSRHGHCRTNPSFMLNHCKLACKVCVPIS
ncbi:zinc metalloproteinase nas-38-like [Ostrea edulis]|uniref:zinc metalloproteinase nas-38-like n=1 Tax=Ostrea edulis TaxID=37623 RepID=UPI0024AF132F|nr:zinc metalloproteinase nas-38-like [Ostrea edulis]